ncbi:zinc finger protein 383 isoform X16 [Amyelois transitella]|uniref:zinc finger protein 383 isoform X16 n=1 Tax=Amyelois transitella TaxID=680683 RepID=UPI0029906864|nr:zinc finger protein 383 isoform X16 [Amyelois transitella]
MAAKSEWRPGPTVCRCCLTEGCYKDISTEYFWMGKREVYAEMLKDTLEVTIAYSKAGGPNSNSRLICESCISRLRDATEFKRQVVECERMFMQHLDPGSSSAAIEAETEPVGKIKVEGVKLEKSNSDDDFDNRHAFGDDDDDDDDDLDNQPLTKLASKMPTKESVDLLDLLDNSKTAEKRKSSTKVKPPPPKKAKSKVEQVKVKPSGSKLTPKPEKKKKDMTEILLSPNLARRNAWMIVAHTTAYPFKLPECSLVCVYCREEFEQGHVFRKHMEDEHPEVRLRLAFSHIPDGYIKVDITDLKCRECTKSFYDVETAAEHLVIQHKFRLNLNEPLGVQPFRFAIGKWNCAICDAKFPTLRSLSRHTQSHFCKYTCHSCGKSYFSSGSLQQHLKWSHIGDQKLCVKCKRVFNTLDERRQHVSESPRCWPFACKFCYERFPSTTLRDAHKRQVHGAEQRTYPCAECKEVFSTRMKYRIHFKIAHTDQYFECSCGRKFDTQKNLEKHSVVHTKEKLFSCPVCTKAFSRQRNLVQHMWIHSENKRFQCKECNKKFSQIGPYKAHMKVYHPDVAAS